MADIAEAARTSGSIVNHFDVVDGVGTDILALPIERFLSLLCFRLLKKA